MSNLFIKPRKERDFTSVHAVTEAANFISVMECEALRIDNRVNAERAQRVKENQLKLRSIVETVIY